MCKKVILLMLVLAFAFISSANAKTIVWVAMAQDGDGDGNQLNDFQEFTDGLKAEGYTVDIRLGNWNALTAAKVAELNAADLVLFSRSIQSGTFATDAAEIALWNSITAPMLNCSPYMLRKGRWNWVVDDTTIPNAAGDQGCPLMNVLAPAHPIFWGVSLDTNNQLMFADPKLASGNCSFAPTNAVGNGTLIAKTVPTIVPTNPPATNPPFQVADWAWIVEWQKGQEFYTGSGTFAGGHRLFLSAGAHETAGNGNSVNKWSGYNLTPEGWNLYLNAVKYMLGELDPKKASGPSPKNGLKELSRDEVISWVSGMYANTHNVFFGTDFNDVNEATIGNLLGTTLYSDLNVNSIDLGRLEYGTTYYWRVDEVNLPSKPGTTKGDVWSFKTEPKGYPLAAASIIKVTASDNCAYPGEQEPNFTSKGLGLDANSAHTDNYKHMWLGMADELGQIWIQYEFDKVYKLSDMLVWNYNEPNPGDTYGAKDVNIAYSLDGVTWQALGGTVQFNQATGLPNYKANTTIDFDGAVAKFVKLTFWSAWDESNILGGVSEVRFSAMPSRASVPVPANAAANIVLNQILSWKAGRGADTHKLYFGTDSNSVRDGLVPAVESDEAAYAPVLDLARTYYWKVDEVNTAEAYTTWDGPVWSFSTVQGIVVDNFEAGYDDTDVNAVWATWKGWEDTSNGGSMGNTGTPYLSTTNYNGGHSAPMYYDNSTKTYSEVRAQVLDLPIGTADWTIGNPTTLTIWFRGDLTNTVGNDQLYCKIDGTKVVYAGNINTLINTTIWTQWDINLSTLGINLADVDDLVIGLEKAGATGGKGFLLIDYIRLTGLQAFTPAAPIFIEAEAYNTISAPMEVNNVVAGASGGQYIQAKAGTTAASNAPPTTGITTYQITVGGGKYVLWGLVSIQATNQDAFWIRIQGATSDRALHTSGWDQWNGLPAGAAWHWDDVHSSSPATTAFITWTMPAGTYTIEVAYRDTDAANPPRLDALMLVKTGN